MPSIQIHSILRHCNNRAGGTVPIVIWRKETLKTVDSGHYVCMGGRQQSQCHVTCLQFSLHYPDLRCSHSGKTFAWLSASSQDPGRGEIRKITGGKLTWQKRMTESASFSGASSRTSSMSSSLIKEHTPGFTLEIKRSLEDWSSFFLSFSPVCGSPHFPSLTLTSSQK